jgi:pseudouridine synthase
VAAERLQKVLAAAGVASRRAAEELIRAGRVVVNGAAVTELGLRVDPERDHIRVDGRRVQPPREKTYVLVYKPKGYVSTLSDPQGRPTVRDLLPPGLPRLFHVGRLDANSEGLLLLTNDGDLAQRVAHPRHGCDKVYLAKVSGVPEEADLERLRRGIALDGVRTAPVRIERLRVTRRDGNAWLSLTLGEGRSRQIRRMFASIGHPVSKLRRVRIGPLDDRGLGPGGARWLSREEVETLRGERPGRVGGAAPARGRADRAGRRPRPEADRRRRGERA